MKKLWFPFLLALACDPAFADVPKALLDCPLSDGSVASLLSTSSEDGQRLSVKIDNHTETAFTDMPDSDFVGEVAMAKCTGSGLIYAMNYGSPYLKGAFIRRHPGSKVLERIDFAEKALPVFLYLNAQQMRLVIPNDGYEIPEKFIVYNYISPKGQPEEPEGMNATPDKKGFEVIELK
ncbi:MULTISPECIES: hypothetical protein [unclassified Pseudomonas]|uniref:hypothetical protein n=1 Tax=unclassified Pseudomonas TaxID=196821 RepID=UPI000A1DAD1D|nr:MULTISPECIES: hypothetical protein [unclassified Pseudomonas]MDI2146261.1 hypothetical protein [Pseudomonas sp. ITA]